MGAWHCHLATTPGVCQNAPGVGRPADRRELLRRASTGAGTLYRRSTTEGNVVNAGTASRSPARIRARRVILGLVFVAVVALALWRVDSRRSPAAPSRPELTIVHPFDEVLFPRDLSTPLFQWEDRTGSREWLLEFAFGSNGERIRRHVGTNRWRPDVATWAVIKERSLEQPATFAVTGRSAGTGTGMNPRTSVRFRTSRDEVGAPLFYREVILPFIEAVKDPATIRWRFGSIAVAEPPRVVMTALPVCGNCHSFSRNGDCLGMDVDYANSKGSYAIIPVARHMELHPRDIISWDEYKRDEGGQTFGLLSQVSPDGRWVVSTVKDRSVFVPVSDLEFSQLFFPIQGILAVYDRERRSFAALPGADDPQFVQSNPSWSPDGRELLFARAPAYKLRSAGNDAAALLRPEQCSEFLEGHRSFQFDLYRLPFNNGQGGVPQPLAGAARNGRSNYFPKYSPDGRWIVFCQSKNYMLLQPDSDLYLLPAGGGTPRRLRANTARMNSWHSWSPNGRWLVFSSKALSPYTQLFLTHIDDQGESSPPVCLDWLTAPDRAANIPEFVTGPADRIQEIQARYLDDFSLARAGFVAEQTGDANAAIERYQRALELNPDNPHAHERLAGLLAEKRGDIAGSLRHGQLAVQRSPDNGQAHFYFGQALLLSGRTSEAIRQLEDALRLLPQTTITDANYSRASIHAALGLAWARSGNADEGLGHLAEAVRLNPTHAMIRYSTAVVLASQGKIDEPLAEYRRAVQLDAGLERQFQVEEIVSGSCARAGQLAQAIELANRAFAKAKVAGAVEDAARLRERIESYQAAQQQ